MDYVWNCLCLIEKWRISRMWSLGFTEWLVLLLNKNPNWVFVYIYIYIMRLGCVWINLVYIVRVRVGSVIDTVKKGIFCFLFLEVEDWIKMSYLDILLRSGACLFSVVRISSFIFRVIWETIIKEWQWLVIKDTKEWPFIWWVRSWKGEKDYYNFFFGMIFLFLNGNQIEIEVKILSDNSETCNAML